MAGRVRSWFRRGSLFWFMCLILALTVVFFAAFAGIFGLYNWAEVWNGQTLRKIYQVGTTTILTLFVSVVGLAVTMVMARYAYATIAEMRKDRRKDTIEKKLEKVYTPLYETLLGARERGRANYGASTWDLSVDEAERIKGVMRDYGHYFRDNTDLDRFRVTILQKGKKEPKYGNSWLFEETVMGPVFADIIETEKETLANEFRDLTKPPGPPTGTGSEDPAFRQERSTPQSSNEPVSDVARKSRLERFDEVFRTLLVLASVLTALYLATTQKISLTGVFQMVLMLLAAMVIWSVAVLWGDHPMARAARLASLELLSIHLLSILSFLFVMIPPKVASQISFGEGLLVAMIVDSIVILVLGAIYLRLKRREIGVVFLVAGFAMVLWSYTMAFLYP